MALAAVEVQQQAAASAWLRPPPPFTFSKQREVLSTESVKFLFFFLCAFRSSLLALLINTQDTR